MEWAVYGFEKVFYSNVPLNLTFGLKSRIEEGRLIQCSNGLNIDRYLSA